MFKYTTLYINTISLIISIIIFWFTNIFISNIDFIIHNVSFKSELEIEEKIQQENQITDNIVLSSEENSTDTKDKNNENILQEEITWYLEIPNINLKADISEGTSKEIMDDYIGHFEETSKFSGNIGLAAHNRGYKNNYFENLKSLKEDDRIYYYYHGENIEYQVINNFIIEDTDWSVLSETDENIITLITCVENEPNYRRCVQAKEIIE